MAYVPRLIDRRLAALLEAFPAILLNGPRAVGKTTSARRVAAAVVRLDRPAESAAFRADPDAALLLHPEPILLDEWQEVPDVLGAVRRAVDEDSRPGRFILTGSVRAEIENRIWPGTGRLIRLTMYGLTQLEITGAVVNDRPGFLDRLQAADAGQFSQSGRRPRLPEYIDLAMTGGFPQAALKPLSAGDHDAWLDSYLDQLLTRDAQRLDPGRDSQKMRAYLHALALSTAGLPSDRTLMEAAGINAKTAAAYDALLGSLFIADQVPAWSSNRLSRLIHAGKRYVIDSALAASAAGVARAAVLADPNLLGRMIDTFAVAQIRPEVALSAGRMRLHHLRTMGGRQEVDLLVEIGGGRILAFEFKAAAAISVTEAKHLVWLRDQIGERFVAGAVLHTGPVAYQLDDRILAIPLSAVWE